MTGASLRSRVYALAERRLGVSNEGARRALDAGITQIHQVLGDLERAHQITRRQVPGLQPRFFARTADADAWVAKASAPVPAPAAKPGRVAESLPRYLERKTAAQGNTAIATPRAPAQKTGPKTAEAIYPPGVKVTRGTPWTHDPRYSVAPGETVYGAGFSAVGIGRSVETGKAWER